jgi:hypothetical protein
MLSPALKHSADQSLRIDVIFDHQDIKHRISPFFLLNILPKNKPKINNSAPWVEVQLRFVV